MTFSSGQADDQGSILLDVVVANQFYSKLL